MQNIPVSGEWAGSFDIPVQAPPGSEPPTAAQAAPPPPARLCVVIPFIEREVSQVLRLLDWITRLSGQLRRTVYLLPFKGLDLFEVERAARRAFSDVQTIKDGEGVLSDWSSSDNKVRDAAGPNSAFRQAAWFFSLKRIGPWLWLEPDCVPLTKNWDDDLEAAYRAAGKPFMGVRMRWQSGDEYLNGAAIYSHNALQLAPALVAHTMWTQHPEMEVGFDVAGGSEVARQAAFTDLIQLEYRTEMPRPPRHDAVLYHGDRTGKLLETLSGGVESRHALKTDVRSGEPKGDAVVDGCNAIVTARSVNADSGSSAPPAQKSSKRKRGDAKCAAHAGRKGKEAPILAGVTSAMVPTRQSNGAGKVQPPLVPNPEYEIATHELDFATGIIRPREITIGDEIRYHVGSLVRLATNSNRKTRILSELRKRKLVRK